MPGRPGASRRPSRTDLATPRKRLLETLLLPPGGPILLGLLGLLLLSVWLRLGMALLAVGALAAYLLSIPLTAGLLNRLGQPYPPLPESQWNDRGAEAIVVLAGGLRTHAPAYEGSTLALRTVSRTRHAARLARHTGLPVIASGGYRHRDGPSEAELMRRLLQEEFCVTGEVLIEDVSQTTRENAWNTAALLRTRGWRRVLLVTQAAHMARAAAAFRRAGVEVIPAPTLFFDDRPDPGDPYTWLPQVKDMEHIRYVLHEWLGRLWYRWLDGPAPG